MMSEAQRPRFRSPSPFTPRGKLVTQSVEEIVAFERHVERQRGKPTHDIRAHTPLDYHTPGYGAQISPRPPRAHSVMGYRAFDSAQNKYTTHIAPPKLGFHRKGVHSANAKVSGRTSPALPDGRSAQHPMRTAPSPAYHYGAFSKGVRPPNTDPHRNGLTPSPAAARRPNTADVALHKTPGDRLIDISSPRTHKPEHRLSPKLPSSLFRVGKKAPLESAVLQEQALLQGLHSTISAIAQRIQGLEHSSAEAILNKTDAAHALVRSDPGPGPGSGLPGGEDGGYPAPPHLFIPPPHRTRSPLGPRDEGVSPLMSPSTAAGSTALVRSFAPSPVAGSPRAPSRPSTPSARWQPWLGPHPSDAQQAVHNVLENMRALIGDDARLQREQAVTCINKHVRGFLARRRHTHAVWAMHAWHRNAQANARASLLMWIRKREQLEMVIRSRNGVRQKLALKRMCREWLQQVKDQQPLNAAKLDRAVALYDKQLLKAFGRHLRKWLDVTKGPHGRKNLVANYQARYKAAHKRLGQMAFDTGWDGEITNEMVLREVHKEAIKTMRGRVASNMQGRVFTQWVRQWNIKNILKGKMISTSRRSQELLLSQCFLGIVEYVLEKREAKGAEWDRRKLRAAARRKGRSSILTRSLERWCSFTQRVLKVKHFVAMRNMQTLGDCMTIWHLWQKRCVELKLEAVEQWLWVCRAEVQVPLRRWQKYVILKHGARQAQQKVIDGLVARRQRRWKRQVLQAMRVQVAGGEEYGDLSLPEALEQLHTSRREVEALTSQHHHEMSTLQAKQDSVFSLLLESSSGANPPAPPQASASPLRPPPEGEGLGKEAAQNLLGYKECAQALAVSTEVMLQAVLADKMYYPESQHNTAADREVRRLHKELEGVRSRLLDHVTEVVQAAAAHAPAELETHEAEKKTRYRRVSQSNKRAHADHVPKKLSRQSSITRQRSTSASESGWGDTDALADGALSASTSQTGLQEGAEGTPAKKAGGSGRRATRVSDPSGGGRYAPPTPGSAKAKRERATTYVRPDAKGKARHDKLLTSWEA